jgi:hypothetical protein
MWNLISGDAKVNALLKTKIFVHSTIMKQPLSNRSYGACAKQVYKDEECCIHAYMKPLMIMIVSYQSV